MNHNVYLIKIVEQDLLFPRLHVFACSDKVKVHFVTQPKMK